MSRTLGERPLRIATPQANGPAAVIQRRAADRLRAGHLWVYRSDVEELIPPLEGSIEPGSLVTVVDARGLPLGTALYSSASQIILRLIANEPGVTREIYLDQVRQRLGAALRMRDKLMPLSSNDNACRLVFSEADNLPGIVADRYHNLVVLQLLIQGTAQDDLRHVLVDTLAQQGTIETIVERPDPRIRELEQLTSPAAGPLFRRTAESPLQTIFTLNALSFHFDAASGQKTGAFLDQRLNYAAAASHAHGEALDICTYQGGFALHLAERCDHVTGVDTSRAALEVADRNLALNPHLPANVNWIEADAFELLRDLESSGKQYGTIVLDPPAFAKTRRAAEGAMRGYKELNLRALKMLKPGGTLVTCSCSHHVPMAEFLDVVTLSASDATRSVQLLEARGASLDHPAILTLPETSYLKCLICRVR